jgi:hypothetical protein
MSAGGLEHTDKQCRGANVRLGIQVKLIHLQQLSHSACNTDERIRNVR